MSKEKIVKRIQKLLALAADNANANESQNALLMAQKMMIEEGLTEADVSTESGGHEAAKKEAYTKPFTDYKKMDFWEGQLAMIIAENFRCFCWFNSDFKIEGKRLMFVGLKDDVDLAFEVFKFASRSIEYHVKEFVNELKGYGEKVTAGHKNEYILGYLNGLRDKFKEQVESNSWTVALVKDEIVLKEYDDIKARLGLKSSRRSNVSLAGDKDARQQGYNKGKQFEYGRKSLN